MHMIHCTDPKKFNKKGGPSEDVLVSLRKWNKIVRRGRGRYRGRRGEGNRR